MQKIQGKHKLEEVTTPWGYKEMVYADRPSNLGELLARTAVQHGDQEAIISPDSRLTYKEFDSLVDNLSSALYHKYGIRKGDRVALMLKNGWEFSVSFFALMKLGAIAVPLNVAYKGEEVAFQLNDSGSVLVIVDPDFHDIITEIRPEIGDIKKVFVTDSEEFLELLKGKEYRPVDVEMDEIDSAVIMYTSGTTGEPKGAVLSHRNLIAEAMSASELLDWRPQNY